MEIGGVEFYPLFLGTYKVDAGPVFGIIPKKIWSRKVETDSENRIMLSINSLLVIKDNVKAVFDLGFGHKLSDKTLRAYGVEQSISIADALGEHGFYPSDITHCILTHLHVDHSGGCTILDNGKIKASLPNANYYIQEREYDDAISPTSRTRATYLIENYEPLYETGQLELVNGMKSITDFITVYPVDGHVNAMNIIKVETGSRNVYYPGDLIGQKEMVHPLWNTAYDYYPLKSEENKINLLERCINEDAWMYFVHDINPGFYTINKNREYDYEAIFIKNI